LLARAWGSEHAVVVARACFEGFGAFVPGFWVVGVEGVSAPFGHPGKGSEVSGAKGFSVPGMEFGAGEFGAFPSGEGVVEGDLGAAEHYKSSRAFVKHS
jgi:hypothetical protein